MTGKVRGVRIAMWSGPRNISTALLRSWGSRHDTFVCDEPLYAFYLERTGVEHPGREEVLAHHDSDWRRVVRRLTGEIPGGKAIFYQKHMAHHLLPEIDRTWVSSLANAFLIRNPEEMLTSLTKVMPRPGVEDTGLPQQWELFHWLRAKTGRTPPIVDARDVLETPRKMLQRLCASLEVPFLESMLSWEAGPRDTDGVWAKHWYASVDRSVGFAPYRPKAERVPENLRGILEACLEVYSKLRAHRLNP